MNQSDSSLTLFCVFKIISKYNYREAGRVFVTKNVTKAFKKNCTSCRLGCLMPCPKASTLASEIFLGMGRVSRFHLSSPPTRLFFVAEVAVH